jgi:hypothetical protein
MRETDEATKRATHSGGRGGGAVRGALVSCGSGRKARSVREQEQNKTERERERERQREGEGREREIKGAHRKKDRIDASNEVREREREREREGEGEHRLKHGCTEYHVNQHRGESVLQASLVITRVGDFGSVS